MLKEAFSFFHIRSPDFYGLSLPPIVSFMETEIAEVETTDDMMDLNFRFEDGPIIHLKEENDLLRRDIIRFAHYVSLPVQPLYCPDSHGCSDPVWWNTRNKSFGVIRHRE